MKEHTMVDLTELSQSLRAAGLGPKARADLIDAIHATVQVELSAAAEPEPQIKPEDAARSRFMAIQCCARLGIAVDENGISGVAFDNACRKGASIDQRIIAKSSLHYAGLLNGNAD
jgi:hypothetical protein